MDQLTEPSHEVLQARYCLLFKGLSRTLLNGKEVLSQYIFPAMNYIRTAAESLYKIIEANAICPCTRYGHCPELELLQSISSELKEKFYLSTVRLSSLQALSLAYREELVRLRDSRFSSGKIYTEVSKEIESNWVSEMDEKRVLYKELLEIKVSLEREIRSLENSSEMDEFSDEYELEDLFEGGFTHPGEELFEQNEDHFGDAEEVDLKMKTCFLMQQALFSRLGPLSILCSLDIFALTTDCGRLNCVLGLVLGALRHLEYIQRLDDRSEIDSVVERSELLIIHFLEDESDQLYIIDEVLDFFHESAEKLQYFPRVVSSLCKFNVVSVSTLSKWFRSCTNTDALSASEELIEWVYQEFHSSTLDYDDRAADIQIPEELSRASLILRFIGFNSQILRDHFESVSCIYPLVLKYISLSPPGDILAREANKPLIQDTATRSKEGSSSVLYSSLKRRLPGMQDVCIRKTVSFDVA